MFGLMSDIGFLGFRGGVKKRISISGVNMDGQMAHLKASFSSSCHHY
jgi:hypothetical protein